MFERELKDVGFIKRWGIVRTIRQQTVDGHTFCVVMSVNDLCIWLGAAITPEQHLAALQQAMWHDVDEIFSSDIPGPSKRALVQDKGIYESTMDDWMRRVFGVQYPVRSGKILGDQAMTAAITSIIKVADHTDAAMEMACELQLGNANVDIHMEANIARMRDSVELMGRLWGVPEKVYEGLADQIEGAIHHQHTGYSWGPNITKEDIRLSGRPTI